MTRPARVAWLLPADATNAEVFRVVEWSTENVGLWRSAMWQADAAGRLDQLGEYLVRKYDPDVIYGVRLNVDEGYLHDSFNPFETFSDEYVLTRESVAASVIGVETIEAAEPQKRTVDRRVFSGDNLKVMWAASQVGVLSDRVTAQLGADGTTINTIPMNLDKVGDMAAVMLLALGGTIPQPPLSPSAIQQRHLALMSRPRDSWYTTSAVVVVGDSSADFYLYWTLRAIRSGVYWAPRSGLADWVHFAQEFKSLIRYLIPRDHERTALISLSIPADELAQLAAQIGPDPSDQRVQPINVVSIANIDQLLPGLMVEVVMYSQQSESVPFVDNASGAQLPRASTGRIALARPSDLHLFHDVSLLSHRVPPRRQYSARLVPEIGMGSRASREGWSFNPLRIMTFGYDTWETAQIGVRLKVQDKLDECLAVFPPELNARLSTPGQYLVQAISLFEDPLVAAAFLTNGPVARVLDAYKRNNKKPPNDHVPGEIMHDRRYLDFQDLALATGLDGDPLRSLLEQLMERRVMRRGFAFQCPSCRWADFYPLGSFDDEFECRQCNRKTRWQLKHAHEPEAPELFYSLDEIVYRVADTDGHAVLRALGWISEGVSSFMVAPGVDIDWPGDANPWEFDSVLLLDGRVVLLEVKNATAVDQKQLNRYQSMAERLRADEVCVVSTKGWDGATTTKIDQLRDTLSARYVKVRSASLDLEHL